jgi:tRNA(Ile)-lysidine synthetase-like protein
MKKIILLINSIKLFLLKNKVIKSNKQILIGISGGQDSIVLLILFFILQKQWKLKIIVLYCHHLWESETIYSFFHLFKFFFSLNFEFYYSISLRITNSEQTARKWRLKNFLRFQYLLFSNTLFIGHTQTDQIETFLFNFFRGSSSRGISSLKEKKIITQIEKNDFLTSKKKLLKIQKVKKNQLIKIHFQRIYFKNKKIKKIHTQKTSFRKQKIFFLNKKIFKNFFIFRPLLKKSRLDIKTISIHWKLPVFPDKTNEIVLYKRNRIRKQLLPSLRFFFNPKIDKILFQYNQVLSSEELIIENFIKNFFEEIIFEYETFYSINLFLLNSFPLAIQRKICFLFFKKKVKKNITFSTINSFIIIITKKVVQAEQKNKSIGLEKNSNWVFFPKVGIIYFYKTTIIFFK